MFLEKILIFIAFLGPLVFFHELGHFLFARFFGVRVEVFSIGFGPKIFKFKRGDTQYAVSAIPLGGYVKMFGDDPLNKEGVPEHEREFAFTHKNKWQRFWIVFGGPLANILIAFVIFASLFLVGEKSPELKIGYVPETGTMRKIGFSSGDRIIKINGNKVFSPTDIALSSDGDIETVSVLSFGTEKKLNVNMQIDKFFEEFSKFPSILRQPLIKSRDGKVYGVSKVESGVEWDVSLDQLVDHFSEVNKVYLFEYTGNLKGKKFEKKAGNSPIKTISSSEYRTLKEFFGQEGFLPIDLSIRSIKMNSAADLAKVKAGDVIVALNGTKVYNFMGLSELLQKTTTDTVKLTFWRDGQEITKEITPKVMTIEKQKKKIMGVHSSGIYMAPKYIKTEGKGLVDSVYLSIIKTKDSVVKTFQGFMMLISAKVSLKHVGGPLSIGKVASDSLEMGITQFLQFMALMSVNLGVVNLFPIPVLDGGHILFIILEIFNRGPLSRRKMEIAQQVGLSLLMILMIGSIFNDVTKFF